MTLNEVKPGCSARISSWCDGLSDRLWELGLLPGTLVEVVRVAPFGDPIALKIKDAQIAIRRADALRITVDAP